ncbi:hypothetical protein [Qipengyuania sp.]|uniref:hypothetical protein n=1 Tax=Qipengyuania sp. TaxID=2004515 RepID=UPI003BAABD29
MSKHFTRELVAQQAAIVESPKVAHDADRSFELPKGLYFATVGLYLGFLAVMAAGLSTPGLIIPMAIFALFIVAGFGLPLIWTRLAPGHRARNMSWDKLESRGIATHTGRVTARDAAAQVLILPVLIFGWGVASVTIAALV